MVPRSLLTIIHRALLLFSNSPLHFRGAWTWDYRPHTPPCFRLSQSTWRRLRFLLISEIDVFPTFAASDARRRLPSKRTQSVFNCSGISEMDSLLDSHCILQPIYRPEPRRTSNLRMQSPLLCGLKLEGLALETNEGHAYSHSISPRGRTSTQYCNFHFFDTLTTISFFVSVDLG